jgi:SAM-dependent methyltransferase
MIVKEMKPEEDAYGQEIWAAYNGAKRFEIVERDDGYINLGVNVGDYFSRYEGWSLNTKKALEFVKGRVLDVGCGAGRHSLYLQGKGFDVLGIDISPFAIKVCKLRGLKKAEVLSIEKAVFKAYFFDTVLMLGNNFGLFGSFKKAQVLLKRIYKKTSKDALIITESFKPYRTKNPDHLEYHELNRKRGRMSGQLRIRIRYKKYATKWFDKGPSYTAIIEKEN